MSKFVLFIVLIFNVFFSYSECTIECDFRYLYRRYLKNDINVGSYSGDKIGNANLYAPESAVVGSNESYEDVWTELYHGSVTFRSGYETNELLGQEVYENHVIIATVRWSNGGVSIILIEPWITSMKYVNKEEILYDNSTKEKIVGIHGNEKNERYWEFYF